MSADQIGRPRAKLSATKALEIRAIDKDIPAWKVAAIYGVSPETIRRVRQGKAWKFTEY